MDIEKQKLKMTWIPLCAEGKISVRKCAEKIKIAPYSVFRLKKKYEKFGSAIWIHGNTGRTPQNKKYDSNEIVSFYNNRFPNAPFAVFSDYCPNNPCYTTIYNALTSAGLVSPKAHIPVREKKLHLPRNERPNEGDLIQIDGSLHDWFMNGKKCTLHGAIDDATHKIVALYFCENECLLGYYQLLWQIFIMTGGFLPRAIYSDKSSCFFVTKESLGKVSLEEQLEGMEKAKTQWQKTCDLLKIELIAANSPQAKGRIERLWQTLQGRLPYIFRYLKIDSIEKANEFLRDFVTDFNNRFSVAPQDKDLHWQAPPHNIDFDFLFSVRADKKTKADGTFIYHGYKFKLLSDYKNRVQFTLCLSEKFGLRAYSDGKYFDVELCESLTDCAGDIMPIVEKNLLYRYFYADTHSGRALIRSKSG